MSIVLFVLLEAQTYLVVWVVYGKGVKQRRSKEFSQGGLPPPGTDFAPPPRLSRTRLMVVEGYMAAIHRLHFHL